MTNSASNKKLIHEILCEEFGCHLVYKAMECKESYRNFKANNPNSISEFFNELSYKWQMGKAKEYLESLDERIQICLICHLVEDYFNDTTRGMDSNFDWS